MEEELESIYFDFKGRDIAVPKMCCDNLKKFKKYILEREDNCDEEMYYIAGIDLLDEQYETYSDIQALKDFIDIGEFVSKFNDKKLQNTFLEIFKNNKKEITEKIMNWCKRYGLLYGEGINHNKTKMYINTFLNYSLNTYLKFEVWTYITMPDYEEKEKIEYANKILKHNFESLDEVKDAIFPQDIKNDVISSEICFFPVKYEHIYSCQSISNVLELQFLFLCTSPDGIVNEDMQYVKILECRNCKNLYATFNARTKYCKYCNDKKTRALARQQKHRRKNKK